ncbi:hypothetical protein FSP39_006796 [Pinctada imbricata]|uniref:BPTI/Kunitz inhibitor domain-containing protein n=1 Tax=Pinctada imbricata TaxID=66713 RepID=A0AA88Y6P2_PINIB|nr:hypothetical protein FSP39_006796 [Pinctada imbricata]
MIQGKCKAMFKNFYFDSSQSECVPFIYGGCGGNDNRFSSLEECEDACLSSPKSKRKIL